MGLINMFGNLPSIMMKIPSSIFSTASSYIASGGFLSFMSVIFTFFAKLFFFVSKWMLYLLDILYSFIQQLCGLDMSYESLDTLVSAESDMVFNLLITATRTINPIIKSLIAIAIALIIFFSILAIIKTQFNSRKNGPADIKGVFRSTIRAFVLLFITPMLAIAGIVVSNTVLKTFYLATNPSGSTSISTQLFSASATSASAYRIYAQNGVRIPITFDYTEQMEILEYYQDPKHEVTNEFREYVESSENLIYIGYMMFAENKFDSYNFLNDTTGSEDVKKRVKDYHAIFDSSKGAYSAPEDSYLKYRKITSYKPEYYVMADIIDYGINSGKALYLKTIEEVLRSIAAMSDNRTFNSFVSMYGIEFLDDKLDRIGLNGSIPATNNSTYSNWRDLFLYDINWKVIRFTSKYYDADETSTPYRKMDIEYNHVRGATDEIEGAKYIVVTERETKIESVVYSYFYPVTNKVNGFESDYIQMGQIISAKGIFGDSKYPTAIRQSEDGVEVQFYRYNLKTITVGDADDAAGGSAKSEKEKSGIAGFFAKIAALFNPKVSGKIDKDKIVTAYTYDEVLVNHLASGKMSLSYMFEDDFSNFIGGAVTGVTNAVRSVSGKDKAEQIGIFGLRLENVFMANKLNILVLFVGALILIKITFASVFSLINRAYELFLIIMIYPTACATIPIDEKGYQEWTRAYTQRLFSTYGIILGLNFVIMLFPVIGELKVFNAGDIAMSAPVRRFRNLFSVGGLISISYDFLADFLNLITIILFELVAFTLLETMPDTIQNIIGVPGAKGGINPIETLGKAIKITTAVISTIVSYGSNFFKSGMDIIRAIGPSFGKKGKEKKDKARERLKEKAKKVQEKAKGFVPGSAIVNEVKDKKFLNEKKKEQKEAMNNLKDTMNGAGGETDPKKQKEATQEAFNKMLEAQSAYSDALKDPSGARKAEEDKEKEKHEAGISERDEEDDAVDDDEEDTSFRSKRELKKSKKRQKAIVDHLEYKKKYGGGLSAAEEASLAKNMERLEKTQDALKKKKDDKMSIGDRFALQRLENKNSKSILTDEQQEKYDTLKAKKSGQKQLKSENKEKRKAKDESIKQGKINKKQKEKSDERAKELKHVFSGSDIGSKVKQQQFFNQMENDRQQLQEISDKFGSGKKVEEMSDTEIMQMVEENKGKNPLKNAQLENMAQRYSQSKDITGSLLETQENHQNYKSTMQANDKMRKNRRKVDGVFFGRDGVISSNVRKITHATSRSDKLEAKNRLKSEEVQTELDQVNQQIKDMGAIDGSNFANYQKLKKKQQNLIAKQQFERRFHNYNSKSKEEIKQINKDEARERKWLNKSIKQTMKVTDENSGLWDQKAIDEAVKQKRKKYAAKQKKKEDKKNGKFQY